MVTLNSFFSLTLKNGGNLMLSFPTCHLRIPRLFTLNTNLIFLHASVLPPEGSIGHHFHNQVEEMYVIFDNVAEFAFDGRTSRLVGPIGVPAAWVARTPYTTRQTNLQSG